MQKQAPSIGRILIAVGFALSCFGLLLFLWIAFGGPIPLKPESYRITAYFPEATQLADRVRRADRRRLGRQGEVDRARAARAAGQRQGHDRGRDRDRAASSRRSPSDARAILRQKTLLGETYVELTSGTEPGERAAPGLARRRGQRLRRRGGRGRVDPRGRHARRQPQVEEATQIDEIFNALDEETRTSFQRWQANAAVAIQGRGLDLNDASATSGRSSPTPPTCSTILEPPEGGAQGPGPRHRRRSSRR